MPEVTAPGARALDETGQGARAVIAQPGSVAQSGLQIPRLGVEHALPVLRPFRERLVAGGYET